MIPVKNEKELNMELAKEALKTLSGNITIALWGQDLVDGKIVLYSGRIKDLKMDRQIKERLVTAGLIFFNYRSPEYLKASMVKWDPELNAIYLQVEAFPRIWKFLKSSVRNGMNLKKQAGLECPINKPEDIIDLSLLDNNARKAFIQNDKVAYKSKELSKEEKRLIGNKQRLLDDRKNKYFYSDEEEIYHDKDCAMVKKIPIASFKASPIRPSGKSPCPSCVRRMLIREACFPHTKQIRPITAMLKTGWISNKQLEHLVVDDKIKLFTEGPGELKVVGKEDSWIITGFDEGMYNLYHNNYVKVSATERYITDGYHNQGVKSNRLHYLFDYINDYSYVGHVSFVNEQKKDKEFIKRYGRLGKTIVGIKNAVKSYFKRKRFSKNQLHLVR
ncbi:hypothetical protein [Pseudobutyrivibrio sp.]|uniref:hypothetical protein n=1 Tax=Pseudobutyrivibrio sp. TaxID=2014367 RepID=UPI001DFBEA7E|nr:hypothetical protein [Pseudobutyrivibrio sp.]MBE5910156.1 hypothetical protein [Pseudobutyrivibrio sp.]